MSFQTSALLVTWIAIAILAFALSGLLRQLHLIRVALDPQRRVTLGPARGIEAPPIDGVGLSGRTWPTVVLFMDSDCPACSAIQGELESVVFDGLEFVAVFAGEADGRFPDGIEIVARNPEAFRKFNISFTPFAVAVDGDGRVAATQPLGSVRSLHEFVSLQRERMATT